MFSVARISRYTVLHNKTSRIAIACLYYKKNPHKALVYKNHCTPPFVTICQYLNKNIHYYSNDFHFQHMSSFNVPCTCVNKGNDRYLYLGSQK